MKTNKLLPLLFLVFTLSCKEDDSEDVSVQTSLKGDSKLSYNQSLSKWNELKKVNGNSYVYEIAFYSWVGFSNTTELKIEDGIVTSRTYKEYKQNQTNGKRELIASYTETKADLGSHEQGAKPLTIDELYDTCASDYLIVDKTKNTLYFETDNVNGIMTTCGFVPKYCADDCFNGIRITSFNWID